jgi:hypothetical protein
MKKIDLANFDSFKEALLASVDCRMRILVFSRKNTLSRMYQHALTADAMKRVHPPGRSHISIELCAPDESKPLLAWWEAFLILGQENWRIDLEPPERLRFGTLHNADTGVESVEQIESEADTRPPPQKPFIPIPKAEIGSCARSTIAPAI